MNSRPTAVSGITLSGLNGANPLGFLTALGALAVLYQNGEPRARLHWEASVGWIPVISGVNATDPQAVSATLAQVLHGKMIAPEAIRLRECAQRAFDASK